MQNENAWNYGPVADAGVHTQPTLVLRPVVAARRWGRLALRGLIVLLILILLLVGSGVFFWYDPPALSTIGGLFLPPQANAVPWNGTDPINILAMGVDQRLPGDKTHSDTIIVIQLDPGAHRVRMVSIPRDLAVTVPDYGMMSKINEGYYLGGPKFEAYTLEHGLGIPINYYAVLRFASFQRLIDALGGVNITVDQNIDDPAYPAIVGNGFSPFVISAGPHHMDGATALKYMRERHVYTNGDEMRVQHQQQLIDAIKGQLISVHTLFHLPSIVSAVRASIVTNLPDNMLLVVAMQILQAHDQQHVYFNDQNGTVVECVGGDQGADLCPQPSFWTQIHTLFANPRLSAEHASIWVQNGTQLTGKAAQVASTLTTSGFNVAGSGAADTNNHAHTAVIMNSAQPAAPYTTRLLRQMFGARLLTRNLPSIHAQLVLLLGNDMPQVQN